MSEIKRDEKNNIELSYAEETIMAPDEIPTVEEAPVEEKKVVYIGKIRDCDKLNVRETPTLNAKILCKLDKDSTVIVVKSESTKEYYKVYLESGVQGYCMKKYMSVKKQEV